MDNLMDYVHGIRYFSTIDLKSRYPQIQTGKGMSGKLHSKSQIDCTSGWLCLFALTNAPNTFIRLITEVLRPYIGKFVVVFWMIS
jgi:hypothetical protein